MTRKGRASVPERCRRGAAATAPQTARCSRVITALLLAATHCQASIIKPGDKKYVSIIRPGDKYSLDPSRDQCTTIIVGKDATGDGGPLTSHTNDCNACDFRLSKVPSKKTSKDEKRDIYRYRAEYPRYLGTDKGKTYEQVKKYYDWKHGKGDFKSMGTVPYDTDSTYAFIDGAYGMMNDPRPGDRRVDVWGSDHGLAGVGGWPRR